MSVHSLPNLVQGENQPDRRSEPRWNTLLKQEKKDLLSVSLWRGAFGEFVGTGLLCTFTIGFGMTPDGGYPPPVIQIAVAVGFFLGVLITAFANVSGGHVNPAISVAFFITGHCTFVRFLVYSVFQITGGVTGTWLLKAMSPESHVGGLGLILPHKDVSDEQALAAEFMITFLLIFVTVSMIDPGRKDVQGSVPFMVGLTVAVNIFFANTTSGACMNPARALGPAIVNGKWTRQWIYWLGPMLGGVIGALLYDICFSAKKLRAKRWCNPLSYDTFGDNDDADSNDSYNLSNNNDKRIPSDTVPLRNGEDKPIHRDLDFESNI